MHVCVRACEHMYICLANSCPQSDAVHGHSFSQVHIHSRGDYYMYLMMLCCKACLLAGGFNLEVFGENNTQMKGGFVQLACG